MSPLTDFYSALLRLNSNFPWKPGQFTLTVMHYGTVVVRDSQTVDYMMTIFVEVAFTTYDMI